MDGVYYSLGYFFLHNIAHMHAVSNLKNLNPSISYSHN